MEPRSSYRDGTSQDPGPRSNCKAEGHGHHEGCPGSCTKPAPDLGSEAQISSVYTCNTWFESLTINAKGMCVPVGNGLWGSKWPGFNYLKKKAFIVTCYSTHLSSNFISEATSATNNSGPGASFLISSKSGFSETQGMLLSMRGCPLGSHRFLLSGKWVASPVIGYKWFLLPWTHLQTGLHTEKETTWELDFITSLTSAGEALWLCKARGTGNKITEDFFWFCCLWRLTVPCVLSAHPVSQARIKTAFLTHCIIWVNANDSLSWKSRL